MKARPVAARVERARAVAGLVLVLLAASFAAWLMLGSGSIVTTQGASMGSSLRPGSLVLVREQDEYVVGDVVAYRNKHAHAVMVHRVVARSGDTYTLKGDANTAVDTERPTRSSIIGAQVIAIPNLGSAVSALRSPLGLPVAMGIAAIMAARTRRRGRKRDRRSTMRSKISSDSSTPRSVAAVTAAILAALAAGAWLAPGEATDKRQADYGITGRFTYAARAQAGSVDVDGVARTGEPVFAAMSDTVDLAFTAHVATEEEHAFSGTAGMVVRIVDAPIGWSRDVTVVPPTPFDGDVAEVRARLTLARLNAIIHALEATTGVARGQYRVEVHPSVTLAGTIAGEAVSDSFTPALVMSYDRRALWAEQGPAGTDPFMPSTSKHVSVAESVERTLGLGPVALPLTAARTTATFAALLALGFVVASRRRSDEPQDEMSHIKMRHGAWIASAQEATIPPAGGSVRLADVDSLAAIARYMDRPMIHYSGPSGDCLVIPGDVSYRYDVPGSGTAAAATPTARSHGFIGTRPLAQDAHN